MLVIVAELVIYILFQITAWIQTIADNIGCKPQYASKLPTMFKSHWVAAIMKRLFFLQQDAADCFHWPVDLTGGN